MSSGLGQRGVRPKPEITTVNLQTEKALSATGAILQSASDYVYKDQRRLQLRVMIRDLHEFIEILRREGEIVEISTTVNPHLEAAEIHRRVIETQGPALLFRSVAGSPFPLVTNLFGSKKRIELAFGPRPERFIRQIAALPHTLVPPSLGKLWHHRELLASIARVGMKHTQRAPILEVADRPARLTRLPLLTTWPLDGGPFITLPLVYTEHPITRAHNLGMYRIQRFNDEQTGLHCQIGKGGGFHLAEAARLGQKLPVNIAIGGPPALILAAIAPLPENVPELLLASLVMGGKTRLAANPLGPLPVLADAEFVLVGEVDPAEQHPEGPFGDHYGYYSLQHDYPLFRCHGLLRRSNPIGAATVVGKPRQEDFFLGDYLQELLSPLFPVVMPAVEDLWSYGETGYHALAAAVVKQRYKREAMASAFRILGEGQLSLTKFLLVTDRRIDLKDFPAVLSHILARTDFRSDLYIFGNLAMDTLDYSGPAVNEGSKGVLLGLGDPIRELPANFEGQLPKGLRDARAFSPGCLVVSGPPFLSERRFAELLAKEPALREWPLVILVDDVAKATATTMSFLWTAFTRFEPAADIFAAKLTIARNHLCYDVPIVIDSRMKPWYPAEVACDPDTARKVDERWFEYFPRDSKGH